MSILRSILFFCEYNNYCLCMKSGFLTLRPQSDRFREYPSKDKALRKPLVTVD
jgi:hypothetical protein